MPFQSEKQRRYLWANEPEIARDWTDTYGSKIHKASGGRIGFARGSHPRALKQRFIEVIRLMNEAEGDELAALALEARILKEQLEVLEQIEPSVGQGIQSLQREEPQRMSLLSKDLTAQPLTHDDQGYRTYPEGYGKEQIFPGISRESIIARDIRKKQPVYQAMKGRMDRKNVERLKELFERHRPSPQGSRVRKANGGIMENILMQLAKTYGMNKAMEMLGMGKDSDQQDNLAFSPMKSLGRFGLNQAFNALSGGSGLGGGFLPMAGIAGLAYLGNKHRLGLTGYTTQGGYEKARQDRINMQRQSNIIKTLESGKYAPGWEKTAFENIQRLGKDLNLVDAADVGLTRTRKPKAPAPVRHHTNGGGGNGGGGYSHPGSAASRASSDPFFKGGLAGLWQR